MRYELKSVPIWPLAKVAFFVHLVFGFVVGLFYAMAIVPLMALMANIPQFQNEGFDMAAAPVGVLIVLMPIFMALSSAFFGTVGSVILGAVYNLIARMLGGLELNLQPTESETTKVNTPSPPAAQVQPVSAAPPPPHPVESRPATPPPPREGGTEGDSTENTPNL